MHRSLGTLDVIVVGLVADLDIRNHSRAFYAPICSLIRPTGSMSSSERGCSGICLALPLAYFQARRVGDSVARVRELENIRNFLTSSALTLVIDLFFTFVFLVVMFLYSPLLTGS